MIVLIKKYPSWYNKVVKRDLVVVNFCAYDRKSNFYGRYKWPDNGGYLMSKPIEYEPDTIKMKVSRVSDIPNIWIMKPDSTNIKYAGYDYLNKHLYLQFHTSEEAKPKIYRYPEVPIEYWCAMTEADSIGSYFQRTKHLLVGYSIVKLRKTK